MLDKELNLKKIFNHNDIEKLGNVKLFKVYNVALVLFK